MCGRGREAASSGLSNLSPARLLAFPDQQGNQSEPSQYPILPRQGYLFEETLRSRSSRKATPRRKRKQEEQAAQQPRGVTASTIWNLLSGTQILMHVPTVRDMLYLLQAFRILQRITVRVVQTSCLQSRETLRLLKNTPTRHARRVCLRFQSFLHKATTKKSPGEDHHRHFALYHTPTIDLEKCLMRTPAVIQMNCPGAR